jgi:hypothetical protein
MFNVLSQRGRRSLFGEMISAGERGKEKEGAGEGGGSGSGFMGRELCLMKIIS